MAAIDMAGGEARGLALSAQERNAAFTAAARHSRRVARLRKGLPIAALAICGLYFISAARLSVSIGPLTASVSGVQVTDNKLRMVNPKLEGFDKKRGSYLIKADYADQEVKNPAMIELTALSAEMKQDAGSWSLLKAASGIFDTKQERLHMTGGIDLSTSTGMTGQMRRATLNLKSQLLSTREPVEFDMINGTVRARTLRLYAAEKRAVFRGDVRVHMKKRPDLQAKSKAKPAEPAVQSEQPTAALPEQPSAAQPEQFIAVQPEQLPAEEAEPAPSAAHDPSFAGEAAPPFIPAPAISEPQQP